MPITNSLRENLCATAYDVFLETFRRKSYLEPERKLMLAVLENGVECFQKYAFARDRKGGCFSKRSSIGSRIQIGIGCFRLPTYAKPWDLLPTICGRVLASGKSRS